MKPKFLELLKLAVLFAVIAIVLVCVAESKPICHNAVMSVAASYEGVSVVGVSSDGVAMYSGPISSMWGWAVLFTRLFFVTGVVIVAIFILAGFGLLTWIIGRIGQGIVWVRNLWSPPVLALDTVIETSSSGQPITLGHVLRTINRKVAVLEEKTEDIEPPKKKTPEEILAEKDAAMAAMQAELQRLRAEANRKTITGVEPATLKPAPAPAPAPTTGGAS